MNRRVIAAAVAGVSIAGSVGTALALPSRPTIRHWAFPFVAEQLSFKQFKNGHYVVADKDIQSTYIIGTDSFTCVPTKTTAACDVAASYKGGQLFGNFTQNLKTGSLSGKITGGTRIYKGAQGTISGTRVSNTKEKVSVQFETP